MLPTTKIKLSKKEGEVFKKSIQEKQNFRLKRIEQWNLLEEGIDYVKKPLALKTAYPVFNIEFISQKGKDYLNNKNIKDKNYEK